MSETLKSLPAEAAELWCGRCGCVHLSEEEPCLKAWERRGEPGPRMPASIAGQREVDVRPAFVGNNRYQADEATGRRYVIAESKGDLLVDVRPGGPGSFWVSRSRCTEVT